jgi:hypothetical protein
MSADLLPTEQPGPHYTGDVADVLADGWDLLIAHPPCTYLANSGVRWLYEKPGRWDQLQDAALFFCELLNADVPKVAVENPIIHKHALHWIGRRQDQVVQPWQYGHPETKAVCLWLRGLPPLEPTNIVAGREPRVWKETPHPERWKRRSRFYSGIADAMAHQWGNA